MTPVRSHGAVRWVRGLLFACALVLGMPLSAQAVPQTIEGEVAPSVRALTVFIGDTGSLQAKRGAPFVGQPAEPQPVQGMFYPGQTAGPASNYWHLRVKAGPAANVTFGPRDTAVTAISNGPVTGDWTAASPARVNTIMRIQHNGVDLFEVRQIILYVAPEMRFRVIWEIRNMTAQAIPFIFGTSADLFIESDAGEGVFVDGPERFIGGRNKFSGTVGGVQQVTSSQMPGEAVATPVAPWASYEEGDPFGVTRRLSSQDVFLNTINPLFMDNGVGVSFDDRATTGLAAGATARYEVIWHVRRTVPVALSASPQDASAEQHDAVTATATASTATAGSGDSAPAATSRGLGDTVAPVLSALRVSPSASRHSSRARTAARVAFRLSERASVVLSILRRTAGRRVTVHKLTRANLAPGSNVVRIAGKRLPPGRYVLTTRAIDRAGNRGALRSATFRISARS